MSNQRLACAQNKVFQDCRGKTYTPGQLLTEAEIGYIGNERIKRLMDKGRIVVVDLDVPEIEAPAPSIDEQRLAKGQVSPPKYDMNPADLEGLELDDLNLLALDIDEDARAYDSVEEAVAALSAYYRASVDAPEVEQVEAEAADAILEQDIAEADERERIKRLMDKDEQTREDAEVAAEAQAIADSAEDAK